MMLMSYISTLVCWNIRGLLARGRLNDCRRIIRQLGIDMFCALETKISIDHPNFDSSLHRRIQLFSMEGSIQNFDCDSGGCILLKLNSASLSFNALDKSPQYIHGLVTCGISSFLLTYVYAYSDAIDCDHL